MAELDGKHEKLSARERQIAEAYAGGRSYREIAESLFIAPATVRTHLSTIYRKLGVSTKIELLRALEIARDGLAVGAPFERACPSIGSSSRGTDESIWSVSEVAPIVEEQGLDDPAHAVPGPTPGPQRSPKPRADPCVTHLLQGLDLRQYAEVFAANAVDMDVLRTLTESDLRELGILAIGHRRRLVAAIHERRSNEEIPRAPPATSPLAERRHLTMVFIDLVESMELSIQLDPEQMRDLLEDYHHAVAREVARFKGHVTNVMGDGVLVYFGWPHAHEDDAERAIRAAVAVRASVGALRRFEDHPLAVRIGIASGLVVVGEGMGQDAAVVGETPYLASRLRALARPGQIIIAESTRRLLGDIFELADLGAKSVTGIPVEAFAVTGERPVETRFDARSGPALLPMVGRDQELALLLERWALAEAGEGQGVLLIGEAGIGKSRIVRALLDALAGEAHFRIRYQCSPYYSDSALWPVIQQLTQAAGLAIGEPLDAGLDKLEELLGRAGNIESAPLIASLVSLDGAARYGETNLTPQVQRARTIKALVEQLLGLAAKRPVLVLLEDGHWIDPTTLELMEQCLDHIGGARVLLVLTSRPDQQPQLAGHPHVTRLTLNRLGRAGVEAIVARLGGDHLPGETRDTIIARTDGIPLFVEELTKAVLETGEATIPASLHDSLMARLDRIPEVKEVAQIAACIGREFEYPLLAAVADRTEPTLLSALDRLAAAELVFRRGMLPEASYSFKHTLVRDAAYQSLLKSRRQQLHARIARCLEERFSNLVEIQPEIIARHLTYANLHESATDYWLRAGIQNASRSAYLEATSHLTMALQTASEIADPLRRQEKELEIRSLLASALRVIRGHVATELEDMLKQILRPAEQMGRKSESSHALNGLSLVHLNRGELLQARSYAFEALMRAMEADDRACELLSRRTIGTVLFIVGDFAGAREELNKCISLYAREHDRDLIRYYSFDPLVASHGFLSWTCGILGHPCTARQHLRAGHTYASELEHGYSMIFSHLMSAVLHLMLREPGPSQRHAEAAISLSAEQRLPYFTSIAKACQGWAQALAGRVDSGLTQVREGLEAHQAVPWEPLMHCSMAEILAAAGRIHEALSCLAAADLVVEQTGAYWWAAEIARVRGVTLLASPNPDPAQAASSFETALQLARSQQAMLWNLRTSVSLARLWAEQGKRTEACDLLVPVYGWFTEGFDTADLKDAKALLDELGWRRTDLASNEGKDGS